MCNSFQHQQSERYRRGPLFSSLLTLIASSTDRELAKYVHFLKEENKSLRTRIKGEIHTRPEERQRLDADIYRQLAGASPFSP